MFLSILQQIDLSGYGGAMFWGYSYFQFYSRSTLFPPGRAGLWIADPLSILQQIDIYNCKKPAPHLARNPFNSIVDRLKDLCNSVLKVFADFQFYSRSTCGNSIHNPPAHPDRFQFYSRSTLSVPWAWVVELEVLSILQQIDTLENKLAPSEIVTVFQFYSRSTEQLRLQLCSKRSVTFNSIVDRQAPKPKSSLRAPFFFQFYSRSTTYLRSVSSFVCPTILLSILQQIDGALLGLMGVVIVAFNSIVDRPNNTVKNTQTKCNPLSILQQIDRHNRWRRPKQPTRHHLSILQQIDTTTLASLNALRSLSILQQIDFAAIKNSFISTRVTFNSIVDRLGIASTKGYLGAFTLSILQQIDK